MKPITDYEIINHGIEYSDYFSGCGTAFTGFTDVVTGIGNSEWEALNDALNQLAQNDWDVSTLENEADNADDTDLVYQYAEENNLISYDCEWPWVFVSVRVR